MIINVILADDHIIFREGICSLLNRQSDVNVIAAAVNGREAVKLTRELKPKIVLMDITMPILNGVEATRQIVHEFPQTKVIALSMHSSKNFIVDMLKAGASGYLLKNCGFEELYHAIKAVASGLRYLSPAVADIVMEGYSGFIFDNELTAFTALTTRQREVLQLLAEGKNTKQIAAKLHVSVKTVETHRQHIMEKLAIKNVAELTKYAIREGLTSIED